MIIRFNKDLTEQRVYANGNELATIMGKDKDSEGKRVYTWPLSKEEHVYTIKDPILMTDNHKMGKIGEEKPILRDTIIQLFSSQHKIIEYNGTNFDFEQKRYPEVWGPSIDTLLFCRGLNNIDLTKVESFLEVGFGSGFISKYILNNAPNVKKADMIDINPYAKKSAEENISDKRVKIYTDDAKGFLEERINYDNFNQEYDLIVCNPPYLPRPKSIDDNAYEGISLMVYLIENAKRLLRKEGSLISVVSSLSEDVVNEAVKFSQLKTEVIDELTVPLKVYNVLNNKEWCDYLVNEKGLKKERHDGYDYWQDIKITKIS
jgi:tRNA1(Val) A37 N6-methylase TrmN6